MVLCISEKPEAGAELDRYLVFKGVLRKRKL